MEHLLEQTVSLEFAPQQRTKGDCACCPLRLPVDLLTAPKMKTRKTIFIAINLLAAVASAQDVPNPTNQVKTDELIIDAADAKNYVGKEATVIGVLSHVSLIKTSPYFYSPICDIDGVEPHQAFNIVGEDCSWTTLAPNFQRLKEHLNEYVYASGVIVTIAKTGVPAILVKSADEIFFYNQADTNGTEAIQATKKNPAGDIFDQIAAERPKIKNPFDQFDQRVKEFTPSLPNDRVSESLPPTIPTPASQVEASSISGSGGSPSVLACVVCTIAVVAFGFVLVRVFDIRLFGGNVVKAKIGETVIEIKDKPIKNEPPHETLKPKKPVNPTKKILKLAAVLFVASCLLPPWQYTEDRNGTGGYHSRKPAGYSILFNPPETGRFYWDGVQIDFGRLFLEWTAIVGLTGVIWMFAKKSNK